MKDMVVIGKTYVFAVWAINVDVAAAAQRAWSKRWRNIHGIQIMGFALIAHHPATVVEIVLPVLIRVLRAVDKHIPIGGRMHRHHADVRSQARPINHLNLSTFHVHSFNGFTGKRCA